MIIEEQEKVYNNDKKRMLVSASAGSGKTYVVIQYITKLVCEKKVPIKDFVILTFTRAAAAQMKDRLQQSLKKLGDDPFIVEQLDALSIANISTIHAYCEKMLKKYANLLNLNANFSVADENQTKKISQDAFENALKMFEKDLQADYLELLGYYKNDKSKIREILSGIEALVGAVANKESFLEENISHPEQFFDHALQYLFEEAKNEICARLGEVESFHVNDFEFSLRQSLSKILESKNIFEMVQGIADFKFPNLPRKKDVGEDIVASLGTVKKNINKIFLGIESLNLDDEENVEKQRCARLENLLLRLFCLYDQESQRIKKLQNVLSFSDLEKYMERLSAKENLFDGVKYVFIDEYQDTNKIQEKIVKNIAKNSNFVAVGDIKQGIYGFRLASYEIFLKDMQDFAEDDDSSLEILKSNFRSSQKVLDFVNDIFKVCMTERTVGVDYAKTAMLDGKGEFKSENAKAVNIDIIKEDKLDERPLPKVYSVKDDILVKAQANRKQLLAIKNRILEVMNSEIYEDGAYRKCRFGDIAILFRKRTSGLFDELEQFLQESGIPVISNSKKALFEHPLMKVLLNWLNLALTFDDDVAMLAVLTSPLVKISLEQIAEVVSADERKLCEIVKENPIFAQFVNLMKEFRSDCEFFGIKTAFCKLFDKTNFWAYINGLKNQQKMSSLVSQFLGAILESGYDFDIPALINYFESVNIEILTDSTDVEDAVTLTTIHNSKGLEYPIVFLCGCDLSLKGPNKSGLVQINEEFGFAVKKYDIEENQESVSVKMKAILESKKKKDFVEEMMIFYVALTRAKNRLYMFGTYNDKMFGRTSIFDCDSYFDLIMFALDDVKNALLENDLFETEDLQVRIIDEIEEDSLQKIKPQNIVEFDEKIAEKLKAYLDFDYKYDDKLNFKLKESVTSLNKRQLEDLTEHYSNDNFAFGGSTVEEGNAYHLALKVLDFERVEDMGGLESQLQQNAEILGEGVKLVDKDILLKNVLLLKKMCAGGQVFKEKQFIMKENLSKLLDDVSFDDEILVQGVVDFYMVKNGEIVLIDYKYSQSRSDQYLSEKYKNQLKLYKMALESGLNMPVVKTYLLSLKYAKLIEIEL